MNEPTTEVSRPDIVPTASDNQKSLSPAITKGMNPMIVDNTVSIMGVTFLFHAFMKDVMADNFGLMRLILLYWFTM